MGIKHVWSVLTPFCERKPLFELRGKTVAVDLSCWICEAQNVTEYQIQPRMYLRNLYFRTCYLLLMEVNPIFVLEGKAPELKYDTIAARNEIQFKGCKPKTSGTKTGKDRSRFKFVLARCEEMLKHMGLCCVKGNGEAESLCAYLNDEGLVDGCISQDSDCFAYGAKIVYRNFSIASQGAYAATGGAVDIYNIEKSYKSIGFGRNKIIAMALLCGSDYNGGVQGIGKESVMKLFEKVSDEEIFDRIKSWRFNKKMFEDFEERLLDKNVCTSCGHKGRLQSHNRVGCSECCTSKGCDHFRFKEERLFIKNEVNMRNKALRDPDFPNEDLIKEFLVKKDSVSSLDLKWKQPDLIKFLNFTTKFLEWDEIYAFQKIFPLLTRWQCLNHNLIENNTDLKGVVQAERIKKTRSPKGIPSYEILWTDRNDYYKKLIPEEQIVENKVDVEQLWSSVEPQVLVEKAYPKLVENYKKSKEKPAKISRRRKKNDVSLTEPVGKKVRKRKEKKAVDELEKSLNELKIREVKKKTTTLDDFFKKAVLNNAQLKTSTPVKSDNANVDFSSFIDEETDSDLSNIIESIISSKPAYIEENLQKLNVSTFFTKTLQENDLFEQSFDVSDSDENEENLQKLNVSTFFTKTLQENDLFEQSFDVSDSDESEESCNEEENKEEPRISDSYIEKLLDKYKD